MSIILSATNLSKVYSHRNHTTLALNNVTVSFEENTFTTIIGRSGSGKTTLLHLLSGLDKPTSGTVYLNHCQLSSLNERELLALRRKHVGFVFQENTLLNEFTVYENIMLPCIIDNRTLDTAYVDDLLHTLGLWDQKNYYPHQLSGGQMQRACIARSLSTRPTILFADEPTGQLDRKSGCEVFDLLLLSSRKYNTTIIQVSHDLKLAQMSDRILYLNDGCLSHKMEDFYAD